MPLARAPVARPSTTLQNFIITCMSAIIASNIPQSHSQPHARKPLCLEQFRTHSMRQPRFCLEQIRSKHCLRANSGAAREQAWPDVVLAPLDSQSADQKGCLGSVPWVVPNIVIIRARRACLCLPIEAQWVVSAAQPM